VIIEVVVKIQWILPLHTEQAGLAEVGGKGANLARLACAGFPVPDGFLITTRAYRDFIKDNDLQAQIQAALSQVTGFEAEMLETASQSIRAAFTSGRISPPLAAELAGAYRALGCPAVAVRSSATAEDLPEMSFAGQQDTYLNIWGEADLLNAVVSCWSSLWTARAIGYRKRNGVPHENAALAVVVQRMVESQVSGVLFTANPLSGQRFETVIDAAFGLGEAIVSGQVEPDQYIVDMRLGRITSKTLGAKALSLHGDAGGGIRKHDETRQEQQALPDPFVLKLAQMGKQAAETFGSPQDIEWAWADEKLYLLQSRPITSLYPTPEGIPAQPLRVFFSFGAVQGMLDPITPLGRDTMLWLFTTAAALFGIHYARFQDCPWKMGGERLWVDVTTVMRNSIGRRLMHGAFSYIEPTIQQALDGIWNEPDLLPQRKGIRLRSVLQILRFYLPLMGSFILNMASPARRRSYIVQRGEKLLALTQARIDRLAGTPHQKLDQLRAIRTEYEAVIAPTFRLFVSAIATGMASYNFVRLLSRHASPDQQHPAAGHDFNNQLLELTRGLPHNPTTQMDLDLWYIASTIQCDPDLKAEFSHRDSEELTNQYLFGKMSAAGRTLLDNFLAQYGGRGLAEIDLGRARWREDPTHVFEMLSSYLQIDRPEFAPNVVFAKGEAAAHAALEQMCEALRQARRGWLSARLVRFFASRMRALMGVRESPKFFAVRLMAAIRWALLSIGEELVRDGELEKAEDLLYLSWEEIDSFAAGTLPDHRALISERRMAYEREKLRRQVPRLLLSDGRAFYQGLTSSTASADSIHGSPVSPGSVEGQVRIVFNPLQANLKPGEILVCPGTDPSWTPLFLSAGGLIMEVGGLMTHGAVVAREYGIPAIVGVDQATARLKTGQRIRMDGSSGMIEVLENSKTD
jgi:rifampicin phosphotransferase